MTDIMQLPETPLKCLLVALPLESINHFKCESVGSLSFQSLAYSMISLSVQVLPGKLL